MSEIQLTCWCTCSNITCTSILSYVPKGTQPKTTAKTGETQRSIVETLHKLEPLPHGSQRWKTLTDAVCYCIVKDALPLDSINDPGFRFMLRAFEPRYMLPDRKALSTH